MTNLSKCDDFTSVLFEYVTDASLHDGILPSDKTDYFLFTDMHTKVIGIIDKKDLPAFIAENGKNKDIYLNKYVFILTGVSLDEALSIIKVENVNYGIVINHKGEIIGILSWKDIVEKLIESYNYLNAQMHAVLESTNDAITVINENNVVEFWNTPAEKLYSIPSNTIIGLSIDQFFSELVVMRLVKEKKEVREVYHQPKAGVHILVNSMPVKINKHIAGSVSAETNVTEVVQLHKQLSKASSYVLQLEQEISKIASEKDAFSNMFGHNVKLKEIINVAKRVAATQVALLIRGESGTGKALFAEAIHHESIRKNQPFSVINVAAIPATLLEGELFGYEGGAFKDADKKDKKGIFELAKGGSIFLDDIDEMSLEMQAKLLRFLQNKFFYRVDGKAPIKVDLRIIAATHCDLEKMILDGKFLEDLYFRLNVVSFDIPPLRLRKDDIPELVYIFVREFSTTHGKNINAIEPELMGLFLSYHWPGNVRELRNVMERLVILSDNNKLRTDNLPEHLRLPALIPVIPNIGSVNLSEVTEQTERQVIMKILEEVNWNKSEAAKKLGVPRSTLYYKLKALKIF